MQLIPVSAESIHGLSLTQSLLVCVKMTGGNISLKYYRNIQNVTGCDITSGSRSPGGEKVTLAGSDISMFSCLNVRVVSALPPIR